MVHEGANRGGPRKGAPTERRARGFQRASALTPRMLKTAGAKRGFAELRLLTEWSAVVGEALARVCRPLKVTYSGRSGPGLGATLVITAEGARAPEVDMQKARIIDRVNAFYGYRAVSRITIDQRRAPSMRGALKGGAGAGVTAQMKAGFAEDAPEWGTSPVSGSTPVMELEPVEGVADDRLALALARLGASISARAPRPKRRPDTKTEQPTKRD